MDTKTKKEPKKIKKAAVDKKAVDERAIDKKIKIADEKSKRYFEAVGRRKKATARVRLYTCAPFEGEIGRVTVNGKKYTDLFPSANLQKVVIEPLLKMKSLNRFEATVKVSGGGILGQAEAIRHGLSRALVEFNPEFSKKLKRAGYLRRDPRRKERKKPGLKKARRAPQWSKR